MFNLGNLRSALQLPQTGNPIAPVIFVLLNLLFNIISNVGFKLSADSPNWRGFLAWQIIGNVAGLVTVLTLTALLRYVPLGLAFTVTTGLAVLGVQVASSALFFHESVSHTQWLGTLLVTAGIALVTLR